MIWSSRNIPFLPSPWVNLYVTPCMLKLSALSLALSYIHWTWVGSSPSTGTPSEIKFIWFQFHVFMTSLTFHWQPQLLSMFLIKMLNLFLRRSTYIIINLVGTFVWSGQTVVSMYFIFWGIIPNYTVSLSRFIPPKGCSCGQTNTFAYSTQCSGRRGVCAMVHKGKFTW